MAFRKTQYTFRMKLHAVNFVCKDAGGTQLPRNSRGNENSHREVAAILGICLFPSLLLYAMAKNQAKKVFLPIPAYPNRTLDELKPFKFPYTPFKILYMISFVKVMPP